MDKVLIFGGYEFLGFYLCKVFLEQGIQVCTIDPQQVDDLFLENKRLLVGRNSNFTEFSLGKPRDTWYRAEEKTLIILSFYDFYLKGESLNIRSELDQILMNTLKTEENGNVEFLFLLPVQFLEESKNKEASLRTTYTTIYQELDRRDIPTKSIFLPTLYGPWQPEDYVFQQALLEVVRGHNEINQKVDEREYIEDALFVEDAITEIVKIVESQKDTICFLTSTEQNHWRKCADFLEISAEIFNGRNKSIKPVVDIAKYEVRETIGYVQALTLQKQHLQRILEEF